MCSDKNKYLTLGLQLLLKCEILNPHSSLIEILLGCYTLALYTVPDVLKEHNISIFMVKQFKELCFKIVT
jgi:hypothetical protein